ncbi:MAG: hybrid sensor histidine kinase/response regulator [bacterium]
MISQPFLLLVALVYVFGLVAIAWFVEHREPQNRVVRPLIYSLTLAVYCSSWTFFGAVGTAVTSYWNYIAIYLGPMLVFLFGYPMLKKLVLAGARQKTTSIADFIGSRYGKRQTLAGLIALVAVVGSLPYIALQLKAVSTAWEVLSGSQFEMMQQYSLDQALLVAIVLAIFAMLFGTRQLRGRERNRGMMAALAVESLVKLLAMGAVALVAVSVLGRADASAEAIEPTITRFASTWANQPLDISFFTSLLLAATASICLPRQFHVTVVEYQDEADLQASRWLFPAYLLLISVLVLPIAWAGLAMFSGTTVAPDTYVLQLPMALSLENVSLFAFIGGFSAATGMVIVAVVTIAIMVSNELVLPLLFRLKGQGELQQTVYMGRYLRWARRLCIIGLLLAAWVMHRNLGDGRGLASIGLISFACFAQLAPAVIGAIYWKKGHAHGVYAGLAAGFFGWFYCLMLPAVGVFGEDFLATGPLGIEWLRPGGLFGIAFDHPLTQGVFWSLVPNIVLYVVVSLYAKPQPRDVLQSEAFVSANSEKTGADDHLTLSGIQVGRLKILLSSFVSQQISAELWRECEAQYRQRLLDDDRAPEFVVRAVKNLLSGVVGATSSEHAIRLLEQAAPLQFRDIAEIVGGTSEQLQFNRDLLQITVETMSQGISVVDADLKLIAWNRRYEQLFEYPARLLYVGCPIEAVYRYNAERGMFNDGGDIEAQVQRRLELLRSGSAHQFERVLPGGVAIQVVGKPMPNGGFVTTYTDVSEFKTLVGELEEAKASLESRVAERTRDLQKANEEIGEVHRSKTRFMQAASHDLMQPISAAKLFVSSLRQRGGELSPAQIEPQLEHIDKSLGMAEHLISSLREIARLDSGRMSAKPESFVIGDLLEELAGEFSLLAAKKNVEFRWVSSGKQVLSDRYLLRRILQNFLGNAVHYTRRGSVLLGCRRTGQGLKIEVLDTGPGISSEAMGRIFDEFERLSPGATSTDKGLGLGLSIARRMANLLGHRIEVRSEPGRGSVFSVVVSYGDDAPALVPDTAPAVDESPLPSGTRVLCIDNEAEILAGMRALMTAWGCSVTLAQNRNEVARHFNEPEPQVILLDYHLDEQLTGLDLRENFPESWQKVPTFVVSADSSDEVRKYANAAGCGFIAKPVKPDVLKEKIRQACRDQAN